MDISKGMWKRNVIISVENLEDDDEHCSAIQDEKHICNVRNENYPIMNESNTDSPSPNSVMCRKRPMGRKYEVRLRTDERQLERGKK